MRFLVKYLEKHSTVLSFVCSRMDDSRQSAKDILLSMVNQLLFYEPHLYSRRIKEELYRAERSLWTKESIWIVLQILTSQPRNQALVCVIDDIDECKSAKWLVGRFAWLQEELDIPFKVVISSRKSSIYEALSREQRAGRSVIVDLGGGVDGLSEPAPDPSGMRGELARCMEKAIKSWIPELCWKSPAYEGLEDELGNLYQQYLYGGRGISPLHLKLSFGLLYPPETSTSALSPQKQFGELLSNITLGAIYEKLLQKVNMEDRAWAQNVLQWICYASRPLTTTELSIALETEFQLTPGKGRCFESFESRGDYNLDRYTPRGIREALTRVFGPLVEFDRDEIHLVHQSLHEFLVEPAEIASSTQGIEPQWYRFDDPGLIHEHILLVSLEYLTAGNMLQSFVESKTLENDLELLSLVVPPDRKPQGFLRYASRYWPRHYKYRSERPSAGYRRVTDFLTGYAAPSWYQIYQLLEGSKGRDHYDALSIVAKLGLPSLAQHFLDATDTTQPAPAARRNFVAMAAKRGHCTVVQELLLNRPPRADLWHALHEASNFGHAEVVNQLLSEVSTDVVQFGLYTALDAAAANGHEEVTRKLLEYEVAKTPLGGNVALNLLKRAVEHGHGQVVKILLDHLESDTANGRRFYRPSKITDKDSSEEDDSGGANKDARETDIATEGQNKYMSGRSLDHDNTEIYECFGNGGDVGGGQDAGNDEGTKDGRGLENANTAEQGEIYDESKPGDDVISNFTEDSIEETPESCSSPLDLAAAGGYPGIVQMLLDSKVSGLVSAESFGADRSADTLLHLAASRGHLKVFVLLSKHRDMSRLARVADQYGRYPIHLAAKGGCRQIVEYLLELGGDLAALGDNRGQQALHFAAEFGHDCVVSVLLDHKEPKMKKNALDKQGYSPLHLAARGGLYCPISE